MIASLVTLAGGIAIGLTIGKLIGIFRPREIRVMQLVRATFGDGEPDQVIPLQAFRRALAVASSIDGASND